MKVCKKVAALITLTLVVALIGVKFCIDESGNMPIFEPVEIREYQGQNLSSMNDLRENSIKGSQNISKENYRLLITGLVTNNITYIYDEVMAKHQTYQKIVSLNCVEGWSVHILWDGVLVKDLLSDAMILPGANTVIFYAYDGYTTSLPLDYITLNGILLAYKMNGVTLPPERGFPFQLVAESKWGYKWIKWVTKIELSNDTSYRGYWESYGYSNNADLNQSFLENP